MGIDLSNPTIQGVVIGGLIGLAGVIVAAIAGYQGAKAGARIGADAAKESARLSQVERQTDRDDARRARFADRKLTLAADLLLAADRHSDESRSQVSSKVARWVDELDVAPEFRSNIEIPTVGPTQPVRSAYLTLDLFAPEIAAAAGRLYRATLPLGRLAASWEEPHGGLRLSTENSDQPWARTWTEAIEEWDDARIAFVDAVRADLGVSLDR